jgi:hypothetical protein
MQKRVCDWCLEWHSRAADSHAYHSGIMSDVALLHVVVSYALFFQPRRSLRQRLPRLGQFGLPPKLLRRLLRGCVVATAHGLVTAPASVHDDAMKKMIWMNCILARVMNGFVMREEMRLQAAATACISGRESCVIDAAVSSDVATVLSYLIADANCVNERDG